MRRVETIAGVSRAVTKAGLDVGEVLDTIVRAVADLVGGSCSLRMLCQDREQLERIEATHDVDRERAERLRALRKSFAGSPHADADGLLGDVVSTSGVVVIPAVDPHALLRHAPSDAAREALASLAPRSLVTAPLRGREGNLGVMIVARYDEDRAFVEEDGLVFQEIADLAAHAIENARLYARADRLVRFAETFIGILGHDLRNPLNAISVSAQLILRADDVERTMRPARRIAHSASRMARMIDQLLDFTRIRVGGLSLQRSTVNVGDICRDVVDELRGEEGPANIEVACRGDLVGSWDPDRLSQLVSNLVANAVAHGEQGAAVAVMLDGAHHAEIVLEVHNTGVIPAELLPVIFEPLNGAKEHRPARRRGLGLGLFIVQHIARTHGGDVDVDSSDTAGTNFRVRLPRG